MKKQKLSLMAILLMALAFPSVANAYDFSAVSPSGHTLYYNAVDAYSVTVTYQQFPGESYDDIYRWVLFIHFLVIQTDRTR